MGTLTINNAACNIVNYPVNHGLLYNWYVTQEDIAPTGWHIPTKEEWETLLNTVDIYDSIDNVWPLAGGKLKLTGTIAWDSPNEGATNEFGFNATGSGARHVIEPNIGFGSLKINGNIWVSDLLTTGIATSVEFIYDGEYIPEISSEVSPAMGYSLRFIKNDSTDPGTVTDYDGNEYPTVKIGDQVWMAANFRGTHLNDGTPIDGPDFTNEQWAALTTAGCCAYNNDMNNVAPGFTFPS